MEKINLAHDELMQLMAHHEASKALVELVNMSTSNMDRRTLEVCLDETLPLIKLSKLAEWEMLDKLKRKYGVSELHYCASKEEVYGRV